MDDTNGLSELPGMPEQPAESPDPTPLLPPARKSSSSSRKKSTRGTRATTAAVDQPKRTRSAGAATKTQSKGVTASMIFQGVTLFASGAGFATHHPAIWELTDDEQKKMQDWSKDAAALLADVKSTEGPITRMIEKAMGYSPWIALGFGFASVFGPRVIQEVEATQDPRKYEALEVMMGYREAAPYDASEPVASSPNGTSKLQDLLVGGR